jgi:hypothetical protein
MIHVAIPDMPGASLFNEKINYLMIKIFVSMCFAVASIFCDIPYMKIRHMTFNTVLVTYCLNN